MLDITSGDIITYKEIEYSYKTLFDNKIIKIMSYNYETILAEKFETIISRNIDNTRMKDYYDLYMFVTFKWNEINKEILIKAIKNTSKNRNTLNYINNASKYIKIIEISENIKNMWNNYQKNYEYAKNISFNDIIDVIKIMCKLFINKNP